MKSLIIKNIPDEIFDSVLTNVKSHFILHTGKNPKTEQFSQNEESLLRIRINDLDISKRSKSQIIKRTGARTIRGLMAYNWEILQQRIGGKCRIELDSVLSELGVKWNTFNI